MYNLETFLVEEGYCYSIKEAFKILECISDDFYYSLLEARSKTDSMNVSQMMSGLQEISSQLRQLDQQFRKNPTPELAKKIKTLKDEQKKLTTKKNQLQSIQGTTPSTSKPTVPTRGQRPQTPRDIVSRTGTISNSLKPSAASLTRRATELTGISPEATRAGGSGQSTGEHTTGKYSDMGRSSTSGSTAALPNKGTSRTGARFPRG